MCLYITLPNCSAFVCIYIYIPTLAPNEFHFERDLIKISIKVPEENFKIYAHCRKSMPHTL
jgi:hypothetical protein